MGIKGLNVWIHSTFPGVMCTVNTRGSTPYDHVLFDLNGIVHQACRRKGNEKDVLKSVVSDLDALLRLFPARRTVLVALDGAARQLAADLGVAWWAAEAVPQSEAGREAGADPTGPSAQWRAAAALLRAGCAVVVGGPHVLWLGSPFSSVGRDVDHLPNMAGTSGWSS